MSLPSTRWPRAARAIRAAADTWNSIGEQMAFYIQGIAGIRDALIYYRKETIRVIAHMSLGVGALAMIGGTVAIVAFLTANTGFLIAIVGYSQLSNLGVEALIGFLAAYANTRFVAALISAIALAATIGAGATAQLGAMRINEEIDALEVIGVRAVAYLVSTRILAGAVIAIPLGCVALLIGWLAAGLVVHFGYGQSSGVYGHYFNTFLAPTDVFWTLIEVTLQAIAVMLVCTYYGFNASGGPAGVGAATGRAVRTSLLVLTVITLGAGLALYGRSGNFHLSG
jgi:phospholipid/cholesterol/gamma-HCH transport system permease protein